MLEVSDILYTGALVLLAVSIAGFLRLARRKRGSIVGEILDRALLLSVGFFWITFLGYRLFATAQLPLNIADLAGLIAPLALAIKRWPLRAILYYWSIAVCIPGLLAPILHLIPLQTDLWFYSLGRGGIIAAAAYDLAVNRYRPHWRDWTWACLASWLYVGIVSFLDVILDADYGYLRNRLLLDPWPQRIFLAMVLVPAVFFVMTLPWVLLGRRPRPAPGPIVPEPDDSELIYST
jgi:hypothetical integral membrane protein (TIGR02206 family)